MKYYLFVIITAVLASSVVRCGVIKKTRYVIKENDGTEITCYGADEKACGMFLYQCSDGNEHDCQKDVKRETY